MIENQKYWKPLRKTIFNLFFFLLSIISVTALWPPTEGESIFKTLGALILVSACYIILYLFLIHFRAEVLTVIRKTLFLLLIILFFIILTRFVISFRDQHFLFLIPFAIIPVVIRTFYDARLALFVLLITIMLAGFMVADPFGLIFISFISGMAAIFSLTNIYRKARFFLTALMVFTSSLIIYIGIHLMQDGNFQNVFFSDIIMFAFKRSFGIVKLSCNFSVRKEISFSF